MLVQKLNLDDLQFEKGTFDGTMAYAQNKVSFTSQEEQPRGRKYREGGQCMHYFVIPCVCFVTIEAAGDPDREMGISTQRDPLLLYAPGLG